MIFAAAVHNKNNQTDELVIFFVPNELNESEIKQLCKQITHNITATSMIQVRDFIAISKNDIMRTSSGKIKRNQMLQQYLQGKLLPINIDVSVENITESNELQTYLQTLWQRILNLSYLPPLDESFFNLGGNSLSSAELILKLEKKFNRFIPLVEYYKQPTINRLHSLLEKDELSSEDNSSYRTYTTEDEKNLLHSIHSITGSWKGTRHLDDSLIVGNNITGSKKPLFWVFQEEREFQALSRELGHDQPVYGMKSMSQIFPVKEYTTERIQILVNRYIWEILKMPLKHPIYIGGNCQGGIITLALAKALQNIKKTPLLVVLMEWQYSLGSYTDPVSLIYGSKSYTSEIYAGKNNKKITWEKDFPSRTVIPIKGKHGRYFSDSNIGILANTLGELFSPE